MRVLNVAEKPSVAKEIAQILSGGACQRRQGFSQYNAIFEFPYEIRGQRVQMVVTSVTGHLMELDFDDGYRSWNSCDPLDLFTAPVRKKVRGADSQKNIERTLRAEAQRCEWLVLWLDCDREGENIAFEVKYICERASQRRLRVSRARFSALIPADIVHAVQNLAAPDERLSLACDARSEIDLRIGAAFTRFQTVRIQRRFPALNKEKGVISYGPCQFPTLGFVVERFLKIQNFEREAFHYISVAHERKDLPDQPRTTFKWRRDRLYDRMACLCIYESLLEAPTATIVAVDKRPTWKRKPLPLTTVELQKRASRWLRISSEQAMKAAESLYNKGLLSYPRTETNKFKEGTDLMALLKLHEQHQQWGSYVSRDLLGVNGKYEAPRAGGADDQAHPPIHPTKAVELNSLSDPVEKSLYEFVARHFLACCSRDARGDQTSLQMKILDEQFSASGLMVIERNYLDIYKYEKWNTSTIPVYSPGDSFQPTALEMQAGETCPPPLLSEADLIAKMDTHGIGTDATIAEHIKTILKREYAEKVNNNTQFQPTTLGLALVVSYEQMGLDLAKPALRAAMEQDCKAIALGQKDVKSVIRSCMEQMRVIFESVKQNADVLDSTFSEHFSTGPANPELPTYQRTNAYAPPPPARVQRGRLQDEIESEDDDASFRTNGPRHGNHHINQNQNQNQNRPQTTDLTSEVPRCTDHGVPCVERTVTRESANKGRQFFMCSLPRDEQCSFFEWATPGAVTTTATTTVSAQRPLHNPASSVAATSLVCTGHNEPCIERTVTRDNGNKGRLFLKCARVEPETCSFFAWKDELGATSNNPPPQPLGAGAGTGAAGPSCTGHMQPCVLRTARTGQNMGREFFACAQPMNESCGFFLWREEFTPGSSRRTTNSGTSCSTSRGLAPSTSTRTPSPNASSRSVSSSSSSSRHKPDEGPPMCECGLQSIQLVSRTGSSNGRAFFKCSGNGQENQCRFFQWVAET